MDPFDKRYLDAINDRWAGAESGFGILVLLWEGRREPGDRERAIPARLNRLLRAAALRFSKETGDVVCWLDSLGALVLLVRDSGDGEDRSESGIWLTRMLYALRETAARVLSEAPARGRFRGRDRIACGAAPVPPRARESAGSMAAGREWDRAVLAAAYQAWRMAMSESAYGFEVSAALEPALPAVGTGIGVKYAPIVSLSDGSLLGYETMPYDKASGQEWSAERLFELSEEEGTLYDNDRRFRELAIRGAAGIKDAPRIFLPVPARIVFDPRLYPGGTLNRIEAVGLRPEQIVLTLTGGDANPVGTLHAAIRHYRTQGFRIALTGLGTDRDSLERMVELKPDYVRLDGRWLPKWPRDPAGECLLQSVAALARKEKIVLLAGGVEREEQVRPLMGCGIGYGLGSWLGKPAEQPPAVETQVTERIRQEMRRRFRGAAGTVSELAEPAKTFPGSMPVSEIAGQFDRHREESGFVIVENGKPVGLLMKEKLHRMLALQFGLPLYWNRPVTKIMDANPLVVEESTPVELLSQTAMAREPDKLYDAAIVTRKGEVSGIVSIRSLLEWVTNVRMSQAQWANPLTGLPGNEPIRRELDRRLEEGKPFSVLYADLDHFKWYNDQYGFHRGDDVIRFTAETLQAAIREYGPEDSFVGHIGGDDFIVVIDYGNPVRIAEAILALFEKGISSFADRSVGPVTNRDGTVRQGAGLSISIALLLCRQTAGWTPERLAEHSALLKKRAKQSLGSSLEWEIVGDYPGSAVANV